MWWHWLPLWFLERPPIGSLLSTPCPSLALMMPIKAQSMSQGWSLQSREKCLPAAGWEGSATIQLARMAVPTAPSERNLGAKGGFARTEPLQ